MITINPGLPTQTEIDDPPPRRPYNRDACTCPRNNMYDSGRTGWDHDCTEHALRERGWEDDEGGRGGIPR